MKTRKLTALVITLAMLALCACDAQPTEPTQTPTNVPETSETAKTTAPTESESETEAPTTEPTEVKSDYIIENGVLVGYTGSDTVLTLPEEVEAIAANAFKNAPSAAEITAVRLGAKVENIEVGAFSGMYSLSDFEVDAYNPKYYVYTDGALAGLDGTLYLMQADPLMQEYSFGRTIHKFEDTHEAPETFNRVIIGGGVLDVRFEDDCRYYITELSAEGQTVTFESPVQIYMNHSVYVFDTSDGYVFSVVGASGVGDAWILRNDGVYCFDNAQLPDAEAYSGVAEYNYSKYLLFRNDSGGIGYKRTLKKYLLSSDPAYGPLVYCVSKDEFYCEVGTLSIEDTVLNFNVENKYTVSEELDLDQLFSVYKKVGFYNVSEDEYNTLDELLAANAQKYERGY